MRGMLTIMLSAANPDIPLPAPPGLERGHGQSAFERGSPELGKNRSGGQILEVEALVRRVVIRQGREGERVKRSRARVSRDLIAPKGSSRARRCTNLHRNALDPVFIYKGNPSNSPPAHTDSRAAALPTGNTINEQQKLSMRLEMKQEVL